jgi:hypothetical protein
VLSTRVALKAATGVKHTQATQRLDATVVNKAIADFLLVK